MEDLLCPACGIALSRMMTERGVIWRCEKCDGRAVGLSLLRTTFTPESINPIWLHALHHEGRPGRSCPACRREMIDVPLASSTPVKVEVCQLCQMIWFDAGEVASLEPRPLPPAKPAPLPQETREAIAIAKVKMIAEQARESDPTLMGEVWRQILLLLSYHLRS
jgi:Zn-finger nucleic acid-binding protein